MSIFSKKKREPLVAYHPETMTPVIKCSICNGEQVAGFKDKESGHFTEVMVIHGPKDMDHFLKMYELSDVKKIY